MKRGFSTIETLAGLAVISIVAVAILLAFVVSTIQQIKAKQLTVAIAETERTLEQQRNKSFSQLTDGTTTSQLTNLPAGQLQLVVSSVNTNLKQLQATASWTSGGGTRSVSLDTYASAGGLNDLSR